MKKVLIIGSTGQIGSELTLELRKRYGNENIVAGYIKGAEPKGILKESGPSELVDVTDGEMIADVVKKHGIDTIYNLCSQLRKKVLVKVLDRRSKSLSYSVVILQPSLSTIKVCSFCDTHAPVLSLSAAYG